jgi:hypothetical protein
MRVFLTSQGSEEGALVTEESIGHAKFRNYETGVLKANRSSISVSESTVLGGIPARRVGQSN